MSLRLHVDFDSAGLDAVQRKVETALDGLVRDAVTATAKVVTQHAKQGPFKDHTRQLRSTITYQNLGKSGPWYLAVVRAPMQYATYVEVGTAAHDIWPKAGYNATSLMPGQTRRARGKGPHEHIVGRGLALRWKDAGGGEHFASMVHHPGGKPYPFMAPAAEYGRSYIRTFIERGFAGLAAALG